jgi:hypothetical protein
MTKPIDRRQFTAGIVAAGIGTGRAVASAPSSVVPQQLHLKPNGWMPNSSLPVLLYRNALPASNDSATAMERLFTANRWPPQWRNACITSLFLLLPVLKSVSSVQIRVKLSVFKQVLRKQPLLTPPLPVP